MVRRVLVQDGDHVQAGQALVELDPTIASADQASVQEQLKRGRSEARRTAALLKALAPARAATLRSGQRRRPADRVHLQAEWQDISARLAKLDAEDARRQAEIATVREAHRQAGGHRAPGPPARGRLQELVEQGFISGHAGAGPDPRAHRAGARPGHPARPADAKPQAAAARNRAEPEPPTWPKPARTLQRARGPGRLKRQQLAPGPARPSSARASPSSPPRWPAPCSSWPSIRWAAWSPGAGADGGRARRRRRSPPR